MRVSTRARGQPPVRAQPRAIARRYARALLDVAATQPAGAVECVAQELAAFAKLVGSSVALQRTLLHPALSVDARQRLLAAIAESSGASPLFGRLLQLLAARDRLGLLGTVAEEYAQARNEQEGRVSAEAVTAVPLGDAEKVALASALQEKVGKSVELHTRVDEAVLGGVLVRMGGRTYDGTLRARLAALRARLVAGR